MGNSNDRDEGTVEKFVGETIDVRGSRRAEIGGPAISLASNAKKGFAKSPGRTRSVFDELARRAKYRVGAKVDK
jgi:hypothetical protein